MKGRNWFEWYNLSVSIESLCIVWGYSVKECRAGFKGSAPDIQTLCQASPTWSHSCPRCVCSGGTDAGNEYEHAHKLIVNYSCDSFLSGSDKAYIQVVYLCLMKGQITRLSLLCGTPRYLYIEFALSEFTGILLNFSHFM